jgi:hypothetical protein
MAKKEKPATTKAPAPSSATAENARVANQPPAPRSDTAPKPDNRVKADKDDLVEVEVVWQDGIAGPNGTCVMPGQRVKLPSAEAQAHLMAGKVELPAKGKKD